MTTLINAIIAYLRQYFPAGFFEEFYGKNHHNYKIVEAELYGDN